MRKNFKTILYEQMEGVAWISLNRPEVHNAMNEEMIAELTDAFLSFNELKDIRAVVLTGNGKSFCAGADINYMKRIATLGTNENVEDAKKLALMFRSVYNCPIPTIALIFGSVFGGANGILSACDIVIAEENTTFAFTEVKLGIAPATIAPFVIKRIGEFGAKELMLTGKRFKAKEAKKWNLVNHVYNNEKEENPLDEILKQFESSAPEAVKETKKLIKEILGKDINEGIDYTSKLIAKLRASEEGQEGMAAFLEKRKPNWTTE
ncbi:MAG TPA: enoyl-CoA hydratase-related protein [Bacteroidales bacterium]|jgi:methylglutaconyl-CoA hydratase|nr:enoyl-CoA hydratase-related protein [Bacteroidales bacterium]|tara:strand:- start:144 stop:935 length:792 start_codon:yes stop_codon:yes gene_type:complete